MNEQNIKTRLFYTGNIDETLKIVYANQEKEKKIKHMSSTQKKRHQRQFAVVHFLIYGMEEFFGNSFYDNSMSIENIVIVYEPQIKYAAEYLAQQVQEMMSKQSGANIKLYSKNEFSQLHKLNLAQESEYVIYIGDFIESKLISKHIVNWKFNQFGFRYGWNGQNAFILFDRKPSSEEFYKMVYIAEKEFAKTKHEIDMLTKLEGNFWDELSTPQKVAIVGGGAILAFLGAGGVAAVVADNKKNSDRKRLDEYQYPDGRIDFLSAEKIEILNKKSSDDEITDEEWEYMNEVSPEYAEEWLDRDEDLRDMSLEVYDELRDFSDYSGIDFDDVVDWKG